ncbi:MAG: 4Fe-4S binding protein [Treponema sp.]|nr:4Fe-4S binding protein [Treponema sp.]
MKPYLREVNPISFDLIPEATAFEAGYLVSKNSGWRSIRPTVDAEKCKNCLQCYLYCPDGVISKNKNKDGIKIDYDFCKGCGICAKICKFDAIKMETEQ